MHERLELISDEIIEQRRLQRMEPTEDTIAVLESGIDTIKYLQGLCENHYKPAQDLLRTPAGHGGSVDIVKAVTDLALLICRDSAIVDLNE